MDMSGFEWFMTGMSVVITVVNIYLWFDMRRMEKRIDRLATKFVSHD